MKKITILIVDDHALIREAWSLILNEDPLFGVVAECGTAEIAIELVKELQPDIVLLDINLPGMNGLQAIPFIRKFSPSTRIIGISVHTQPSYARQMMKEGAAGYITKNSSTEELFHALKEIQAGRKYICKEIRDILAEQVICGQGAKGINDLSIREMEVVGLLKKGFSSKEIADTLFLSVKTVEIHRYNVLKKLNLRNTAALINFVNQNYSNVD